MRSLPLALFALACPALAQDTLLVPEQYSTIQEALDASTAADTILVGPGVYHENLLPADGVSLVSRHGPSATIIDGGGLSNVILFQPVAPTGPLNITGFTLRNGHGGCGGGLFMIGPPADTGIVNMRCCVVKDNEALGFGGGLAFHFGHFSVEDTVISGNRILGHSGQGGEGGGVHAEKTLSGKLLRCTVVGNATLAPGSYGGGAFTVASNIAVIGCILQDNLQNGAPVTFGAWNEPVHTRFDVSYTNFDGANQWIGGHDNIDANPRFVGAENDDFHLRPNSPCLHAGDPNASGALDFEGDVRTGQGDMGADQRMPHVYHVGPVQPGGRLVLRVTGVDAQAPLDLWLGESVLDEGRALLGGTWWIAVRRWLLLSNQPMPSHGHISKVVPIAGSAAPGTVLAAQVIADGTLLNVDVAVIE